MIIKNRVLSITMPKFLAFALIPIVLLANVKVSNDDGCFLKREVFQFYQDCSSKCSECSMQKHHLRMLEEFRQNQQNAQDL